MIWIFGDSYSTSFSNPTTLNFWAKDYISWKGYIPKTFGEIISEELDTEITFLSESSVDNDTIFELICENAPLINEGDIIIIGWSSVLRFRISNDLNEWVRVMPTNIDKLNILSKQTLNDVLINRSLPIYKEEYRKRRDFINWIFKNNAVIHWTPFVDQFDFILGYIDVTTIKTETNGKINDGHYSEMGHRQLAKNFMDLIKYDNIRKFGNSNDIRKKNPWKRLL